MYNTFKTFAYHALFHKVKKNHPNNSNKKYFFVQSTNNSLIHISITNHTFQNAAFGFAFYGEK